MMRVRPALFWLLVVIQLWIAHAVGFMMHEYAHSFTAWLLHYKVNPLALDYGHLSLDNVLWQSDIDENVDYKPIFASGHGPAASLIAVSGVLIGNGISYIVSRQLYTWAKQRKMHGWAMFFYWICVMSVGNFLCYVPIRTFTTHADMATTAQGLNMSPWVIAIALGVPFTLVLWHFISCIRLLRKFRDSRIWERFALAIRSFCLSAFSDCHDHLPAAQWARSYCRIGSGAVLLNAD